MLTQPTSTALETIPYGRGTFDRIVWVPDPEASRAHLRLGGWLVVTDHPVDGFEIRLNGHTARCEVIERPDVAEQHPWIAHALNSGYEVVLPSEYVLQRQSNVLDVIGCWKNQPVGRMSTVFRTDVETIPYGRGTFDRIIWVPDPEARQAHLRLGGWLLVKDQPVDCFEIQLNGHTSRCEVLERPDVAEQHPWIAHALNSGYEVLLPSESIRQRQINVIDVIGYWQNQPVGRMSTVFRTDLEQVVPTPPEELRVRVTGSSSLDFFKVGGLCAYGQFHSAIMRHHPQKVRRLLDWGCGCGRVTAHFLLEENGPEVYGCDVDGEAVAWCRKNLKGGHFSKSSLWPPLPYDDGVFDVIIAFSVFTHLTRDAQSAWLHELSRVIAPGGLLLASVHGEFAGAYIHPETTLKKVLANGFSDDMVDVRLKGVITDGYYRATVQSYDYTHSVWSKYFDVVEYVEGGMQGHHDLVVLRQRPETGSSLSQF